MCPDCEYINPLPRAKCRKCQRRKEQKGRAKAKTPDVLIESFAPIKKKPAPTLVVPPPPTPDAPLMLTAKTTTVTTTLFTDSGGVWIRKKKTKQSFQPYAFLDTEYEEDEDVTKEKEKEKEMERNKGKELEYTKEKELDNALQDIGMLRYFVTLYFVLILD